MFAVARREQRAGPATGTPATTRRTPGRAGRSPVAGACPCGGSCPRCGNPHLGGAPAAGSETAPAAAPPPAQAAAAPAPAAAVWATSWGPFPQKFRSDGHLAEWAVRFAGLASGQWLIQRITNSTPAVTHCDQSAYPGDGKLFDPPPAHYLEAWWIDAAGDVKVPTSLETPPSTKDPSGYGHDMWKFNANSKKPTRGSLYRTGLLYQAPALPADFGFNHVAAAHLLPATETRLTGFGPKLGDSRTAQVEWDHQPPDGTEPWTEIQTSKP